MISRTARTNLKLERPSGAAQAVDLAGFLRRVLFVCVISGTVVNSGQPTSSETEKHCAADDPKRDCANTLTRSRRANPLSLFRNESELDWTAAVRLEAHATWQRQVLEASPSKHNRFLIFRPRRTGLGNVIEAAVSSLLVAVVTKRVFLVDWAPTEGSSTLPFITEELRDALDPPLASRHLDLRHPAVLAHIKAAGESGAELSVSLCPTRHRLFPLSRSHPWR